MYDTGNLSLTGRIAHCELGYIPESAKERKSAAGFLITSALFLLLNQQLQIVRVSIPANELAALLIGGAAAAALGAIDDFLDLRARWQLIGQVGLALFA